MARNLNGATLAEKMRLNIRLDGGCWRWTGAHVPSGYGQIAVDGKRRAVHRVSYELSTGPIPDGLEIDHLCRVRDCVNPRHLEAVTHAENLRRALAHKTHCVQGHELSGPNIKWGAATREGGRKRRCRACFNADRRRGHATRRAEAGGFDTHG